MFGSLEQFSKLFEEEERQLNFSKRQSCREKFPCALSTFGYWKSRDLSHASVRTTKLKLNKLLSVMLSLPQAAVFNSRCISNLSRPQRKRARENDVFSCMHK